MNVSFDFETRSTVDLKKCGMHKYAEDETTDVLCCAFKVDDKPTKLWIPEKFRHLDTYKMQDLCDGYVKKLIREATTLTAFNAGFEACMWHHIMRNRYGFPSLPIYKLRCSAAKAANFAIPRSLGLACKAMRVSEQKDTVGYKTMLKCCKPRKPRKAEREANPDWASTTYWHENPEEFKNLLEYCKQDVESEYALSESLYDLSESEQKIWFLDFQINNRGVCVDTEGIDILLKKVAEKETALLLETQTLTGGKITSPKQVSASLRWLHDEGVHLDNLKAPTVKDALEDELPAKPKRLLEIRQALSKSSVAKLTAMKNMACSDDRIRGIFLYAGARTKRWAGRGVQPQNLPRETYNDNEIHEVLHTSNSLIEILYGDVMETASRCIRGMLISDTDKHLFCADFSSIEARVLAWIAREEKIIKAYRKGLDIYKVNAVDIFKIKYEEVSKQQRQIGKVAELSLGYQGWIGAFNSMSEAYGIKIDEERSKEIIISWREMRRKTTSFWKGIEDAAIKAIKTKQPHSYGHIKFGIRGNFLHCRLPSNGLLSYAYPGTTNITTPYGVQKEVVTFWGVGSDNDKMLQGNKAWGQIMSYGGKLTENIVQAISRDLLAEAMLRVEENGFPIVMHVHDEIVSELPLTTDKRMEEYLKLLSVVPEWANGLPLDGTGWVGKRYRK